MKSPHHASILFSAFLLGGVAVLMLTREPTIPMILLGIGVFWQSTVQLPRERQTDPQSERCSEQPTTVSNANSKGDDTA